MHPHLSQLEEHTEIIHIIHNFTIQSSIYRHHHTYCCLTRFPSIRSVTNLTHYFISSTCEVRISRMKLLQLNTCFI